MRLGFYPKLAWTNIRKNKQVYLPYILTATGIVMMFYIVAHLAEDKEVASFPSGTTLQLILTLGMIVIGVFSVIFLYYINSFLMKRRKTELGLYNVLGMGKIHIARILFWETLYIAGISLGIGILAGILFSKVGQLGLFKILAVNASYTFRVYGNVVWITVLLFTAIFALIYLNSLHQIMKSSARELLSSNAAGEKEPRANFLLALIGVILLAAGYVLATIINNPLEAIGIFFIAVILVILGTYACFIAGSVALFKLLRKNKNYYYKPNHFMSVSSMIYRMKRNGAGLASICILSTMVLVMISSTACMYIGGDDAIDATYPREMDMTVYMGQTNRETFDVMVEGLDDWTQQVCEETGVTASRPIQYRMCTVYGFLEGNSLTFLSQSEAEANLATEKGIKLVYLIPLDDYNKANETETRLNPGEALVYDAVGDFKETTLQIGGPDEEQTYQVKEVLETMAAKEDSIMGITDLYIVVPDMDDVYGFYEEMLRFDEETAGKTGDTNDLYGASLRYWYGFDTGLNLDGNSQLIDRLYWVTIGNENQEAPLLQTFDKAGVTPDYETLSVTINSALGSKESFYGLYGGFFFLGILLSLTFLLATVLVMYYKQITEGYDDKDRFEILRKVGMSDQEIRKSINSQVLTVFFAPLVLAGIHIAFAFHMISLMLMVFAISNTTLLIQITVGAYLLFAVFYVAVYLATSKVYYRLVSGGSDRKRME